MRITYPAIVFGTSKGNKLLWAVFCLIILIVTGCSSGHDEGGTDLDNNLIFKTIALSSQVYWQNTEIYLRPGDQVILSASGSWTMDDGTDSYGPEGSKVTYDNCQFGELVANVGLHYNGLIVCVGNGVTFTADTGGLLYLSAWAPWDVERHLGGGSVTVQIEAEGVEAPTLSLTDIPSFDLMSLTAEELEIASEHIILTVSRSKLIEFQMVAAASLVAFEDFYQSHLELAGACPYNGQPIRYFPDADTRDLGTWAWMLSGNPIRLDPLAAYGEGPDQSNLLQSQHMDNSVWGFVHEMGHDFTFTNGGLYLIGAGPTEAWANMFTLYTLDNLGYPEANQNDRCRDLDGFFQNGDYQTFENDTWLPLCMFFELKEIYGWQLFADFFRYYNSVDREKFPGKNEADEIRWSWLNDEFGRLTGDDVSAIFVKYHVPITLLQSAL